MTMTKIGLYVHIPFCASKCPYCDFFSIATENDKIKEDYLSSLKKETIIYSRIMPGTVVQSIYLGGGTPTTLSGQQIAEILGICYQHFKLEPFIEITIESNPATFNRDKAEIIFQAGVNRISIGAQSFNDQILKKIGRIHTKQDIIDSYSIARAVGFKNINFDIMIGLPGQTLRMVEKTLEEVIHLYPEHISLYALSIEEGTPFDTLLKRGSLKIPAEDVVYEMYQESVEYLNEHGYEQYEISNFSIPNKSCLHNQIYWKNQPYLGLGASATSYIKDKRFKNYSDINEYIDLIENGILPIETKEVLNLKEKMAETVILQLRMMEGLSKIDFLKRFNRPVETIFSKQLEYLKNQGLLGTNESHYFLTKKGIPLANIVFMEFLE